MVLISKSTIGYLFMKFWHVTATYSGEGIDTISDYGVVYCKTQNEAIDIFESHWLARGLFDSFLDEDHPNYDKVKFYAREILVLTQDFVDQYIKNLGTEENKKYDLMF